MLHNGIRFAASLFEDSVRAIRKLPFIGHALSKPKAEYVGANGGGYASQEFFKDLYKGNKAAGEELEEHGYGYIWDFAPGATKREIVRNEAHVLTRRRAAARIARETKLGRPTEFTARAAKGKSWMRMDGILSGSPMKGFDRAASNLLPWGSQFKQNLAFGAVLAGIAIGTAPRGEVGKRAVETAGALAGQAVGGAIGGVFGGLGEFVGQMVGATVGERVGHVVDPIIRAGREARHPEFGGAYQDSEPVYTMRQRAIQEMGSSSLNARQYLGREALLMHS